MLCGHGLLFQAFWTVGKGDRRWATDRKTRQFTVSGVAEAVEDWFFGDGVTPDSTQRWKVGRLTRNRAPNIQVRQISLEILPRGIRRTVGEDIRQ